MGDLLYRIEEDIKEGRKKKDTVAIGASELTIYYETH
jgi:hypothetical protein